MNFDEIREKLKPEETDTTKMLICVLSAASQGRTVYISAHTKQLEETLVDQARRWAERLGITDGNIYSERTWSKILTNKENSVVYYHPLRACWHRGEQ